MVAGRNAVLFRAASMPRPRRVVDGPQPVADGTAGGGASRRFLTARWPLGSNSGPFRAPAVPSWTPGRPHGQVAQLVEQRTENPRVGGSIPPLATTYKFLKRNGFPASPSDHRRAAGPKIGRPSDSRESGRCTSGGRRASAVSESGVAPAAAPSPPEWMRGASPRGGHGGPHGRTPRVSRVAMEVSSLGGATRARESPFGKAPSYRGSHPWCRVRRDH